MKKILQRIGLLAMAGMLLWGWQGMNAKAADENKFTIDDSVMDSGSYDKGKTKIVIEELSGEEVYYLLYIQKMAIILWMHPRWKFVIIIIAQ